MRAFRRALAQPNSPSPAPRHTNISNRSRLVGDHKQIEQIISGITTSLAASKLFSVISTLDFKSGSLVAVRHKIFPKDTQISSLPTKYQFPIFQSTFYKWRKEKLVFTLISTQITSKWVKYRPFRLNYTQISKISSKILANKQIDTFSQIAIY